MTIQLMPGESLRFSPENLERLGTELASLIDDLEQEQAVYLDNIGVWWDLYEAIPLAAERTEPFQGASNVVVPLIRWHADAVTSRYLNTLFAASKFWTLRSANEAAEPFRAPLESYQNWAADGNDYDLHLPSYDVVNEAVAIGSGVWQLGWATRREQMFVPGEGGRPRVRDILLGAGPTLEHIPREHILWESHSPIHKAEIVVRQSLLTRSSYARMGQRADWDPEVVEATYHRVSTHGSRGAQVREARRRSQGLGRTPNAFDLHDIRECWVRWPLMKSLGVEPIGHQDPEATYPPIVVTLHKDSRRVLRVIAKPYLTRDWPFYEAVFRRISGRTISGGISKMLDHLQRGATTILNQAIDSNTIRNALNFKTTNPRLMGQEWRPNRGLLVDNMDEFDTIEVGKNVAPDISLLTGLFGVSERLIGINDPALGREIRLGGHPSPATSTLTMLAESKEMLRASLKLIRMEFGRLGEDIGTLQQQFETNFEKIRRAIGEEDSRAVEQWLSGGEPFAGNLTFDVRALSETMNPDQERQNAILVSQVTANYFSRVLQGLQVAQQAKAQGAADIAEAAIDSVRAFGAAHRRFLEASDIDDIDTYLHELQEGTNDQQQLAGRIQQLLQSRLATVAPGAGAAGAGPVPPGNGSLPLGGPGAAGPTGF